MAVAKKTVVFDLDGTLADLSHRKHLIQRPDPDWDLFYESCDKDGYHDWLFELLHTMLEDGYKIAIVSARHEGLREKTIKWLASRDVLVGEGEWVDLFLVRKSANDYRPDTELKKEWLDGYGRDRILFVVDDRQKVVDMWRREGCKVLQCDKWTEYKRPKKPAAV